LITSGRSASNARQQRRLGVGSSGRIRRCLPLYFAGTEAVYTSVIKRTRALLRRAVSLRFAGNFADSRKPKTRSIVGFTRLPTSLDCSDQGYVGTLVLIHVIENATLIIIYTAVIIAQRLGKGDSPRSREFVALPGKYFVSGSP
jgi:hypothetical protein